MRSYFTRRLFLSSTVAVCGAGVAAAWQQEPVFSTEVKVVNVLATVRDKKGGLVTDLGRDDFSISEDDRPQTIRYFARDSDLPLTIGLMVDTSASQRRVLDAERGASYRFLERVLRPTDQAFIMQFDSAVQLRQPLTSDFRQLSNSLAYVDTETVNQLRMQNGGGTLLYDAVAKASDEIMRSRQGRKALILLTDGVDFGSNGTPDDAIAAAQRAETLAFSILYSDPGAYGLFGGPDGRVFWSASPAKPAAASSKSPRNIPSTTSFRPSKLSCAANTASVMFPIGPPHSQNSAG